MKNNSGTAWVWVLIFIVGAIWVGNKFHNNWINAEKDPFWTGTQQIQVCKTPYYSSKECYKLYVELSDSKKRAKINFSNGGFKIVNNITCYFAGGSGGEYQPPRYVFCRSWDSDGQQWDFMPLWVNY